MANFDTLRNIIKNAIKTNGVGSITGSILQQQLLSIVDALETESEGAQPKLISGQNIKTINNQTLLGSGNISVQGGSGGGEENVQSDWNETNTSSDAYIKNKPDLSKKQDQLISGTNIKKINGQSILGSGNLEIAGGSGEVIVQTIQSDWNETDPSSGAFIQNKPDIPAAVTENTIKEWGFTKNEGTYSKPEKGIPKTDLASGVQESLDKADTAIQSVKTINNIPIEGEGNINVGTIPAEVVNVTTLEIQPNKFYVWLAPVTSLSITLAPITDTGSYNEYMFQFQASPEGCTLSLPSTILWANGVTPTIQSGSYYQISIVNNYAVFAEFAVS